MAKGNEYYLKKTLDEIEIILKYSYKNVERRFG